LRLAGARIDAVAVRAEGLATATEGGRVWLWPGADRDVPPRAPEALRARLEADSTVEVDDAVSGVAPSTAPARQG
jgi:hypothetical protein